MLLRNTSFGLAVAIIPITIQLVFVAVRKPYICGDDARPIINLCFTILIISSVLISNILPSFSAIQVYVPIGICIMLTITLGSNTYYLVMEFKETFCSGEEAAALGKEEGKGVG
jgi:membrane-associated HD superfamily phosphohydrolase